MRGLGGLAAATLALVLSTSCASRPLPTPTPPIVAPTPVPAKPSVPPKPTAPPTKPAPISTATAAPATATPPAAPTATRPPATSAPVPASPKPGSFGSRPGEPGAARAQPPRSPPSPAGRVRLTAADGYITDGGWLSPSATDHPAVGNLARDLRAAVQRAATDAARDGVDLVITSGWRSARYQQSLLDAAIAQYGSEAEARRWVSTPEKSDHVTGRAVDIGPEAAQLWLRQHGNRYGLCQTYANEPWHYELATEPGGICPRPIADASAG
jgi:D-alanyl-D-alanine carboxypeptidase